MDDVSTKLLGLLGRYTSRETEFMNQTKKRSLSDNETWFSPVLKEMSEHVEKTEQSLEKNSKK